MVEGARLESEYRSKAYRGFESHPLRQVLIPHPPDPFFTSQLCCGFERRFGSLCVPQDPVRHFSRKRSIERTASGGNSGAADGASILPIGRRADRVPRVMKTDLDHLPANKQRELERVKAIVFEEFEDAIALGTMGWKEGIRI